MDQYRAAVIGLGKIGLPLAAQFAGQGIHTIGCDISLKIVKMVNAGQSHIEAEDGLAERVASAVGSGLLRATSDTAGAVAECNVVVVIVPLLVDEAHRIDYSSIDAAAEAVGKGLRKGTLVVFETTLPVGTTRTRLVPALEQASGMRAGADFYVAFSPERVYSGRIFSDLARYPKVIGGLTPDCTVRAEAFYRVALEGAPLLAVRDSDTAEMVKLMETTYRDVNIALANVFARFAAERGLPVIEVIEAANSQPFSHIHRPGIAVGGHCIPVYPYFLMEGAAEGEMRLLREAREVNDGMPAWAVGRLERALGGLKGKRVLLLGLSYRENVKEAGHSGALSLITLLKEAGAQVGVNDPHFTAEEIRRYGGEPTEIGDPDGFDAVILQAYHNEYRSIEWGTLAGRGCKVVVDGRNALDRGVIESTGMIYIGMGG